MDVFVCGTLTEPARADAVSDDWRYVDEAVLEGLHRVDGAYPTLAPGGRVEGRLLRTTEIDRLDVYEGVDRGLYVRVSVHLRDGAAMSDPEDAVTVYVGDPEHLDALAEWPGESDEQTFRERVEAYVDGNDVFVRLAGDRQH